MKVFFTGLFVVLTGLSVAAVPTWYDWDYNRSKTVLTSEELGMPELVLKHHIQYDYDLEGEDSDFVMYFTMHRIIYVNSNESIKRHNRIIIHMKKDDKLTGLKARTISKTGKVVLFDQANIKELKDEESGSGSRIFAIEGAELGGEIEYYFTRRTSGSIYRRDYFQSTEEVKAASFQLSCPKHLLFDFRTYNGLPAVKKTNDTARHRYEMEPTRVVAKTNEPYAANNPNLMRLEFKLAYNMARSKSRMYTMDDAAKSYYRSIINLDDDDRKAVEKFIKTIPGFTSLAAEARIRALEKAIKINIRVNEDDRSDSNDKVSNAVKYKIASGTGMTKVFVAAFEQLKIPYQVVITCSREKVKFDAAFDTWSYLEEYLLYFPDYKTFLAPYNYVSRYPLIPSEFTAQKGLFIEPLVLGEQRTALGTVRDIPAPSHFFYCDDLAIDVSFGDNDANTVKLKRTFTGYGALDFSSYLNVINDDKKKVVVDELMKQTAPDAQIKKWDAYDLQFDTTARFVFDVDFTTSHFIERAGNRLLFKAGLLIGPQSELYRDDERLSDVENTSNRTYRRAIRIALPAGYTLRNPEALNMDVRYDDSPMTPFVFKSSYRLDNNILEIRIWEGYREISCPKARYEDFRKVINAAADFNKVVLVLEKR